MTSNNYKNEGDAEEEEKRPLNKESFERHSTESISSVSTTSLILEGLSIASTANDTANGAPNSKTLFKDAYTDNTGGLHEEELDLEDGYGVSRGQSVDKSARRVLWLLVLASVGAWLLTLLLFLSHKGSTAASSSTQTSPAATSRKTVMKLNDVLYGTFRAASHEISWIEGANGEDGLLLTQNSGDGADFLIVEDIRSKQEDVDSLASSTLMRDSSFVVDERIVHASKVWPSPDLKKVLVLSDYEKHWRHSFYGKYWIFDVATQTGQALDSSNLDGRVQLASWSPQSDAIVFTRDNNMFLRKLLDPTVTQITHDGGAQCFYGVPDWVYEEEVFQDRSVTWWSDDGKYVAFMRTNESMVPEYPVQFFISRPSGILPEPGLENYPEVSEIKYPKAGAPNPEVNIRFYDVGRDEVFKVDIASSLPTDNRIFTEVTWAGHSGKVIVREANRESDVINTIIVDVERRTGQVARTVNVSALDGGWVEPSQNTKFVPGDPSNGRPHDGYITTVIHDGYDHLAYFTPIDSPNPVMLTSGKWEVVNAPSAIDLSHNLVYFTATKESSLQRHIYSVKLDGTEFQPLSNTSTEGYYAASFSSGAGYALLSYKGPSIPTQKVITTPSNAQNYTLVIEENAALAQRVGEYDIPTFHYSTITIDNTELNVVERRPPNFDTTKKYPVLFYLYGGPASQSVDKTFKIDFQAYIAASLGYLVVTVDGRGTGYIGRKARCVIRGNIGYYEAHDQIATAKEWAKKNYVDPSRLAIWGWSYGGFLTLKTLEQDAGRTFKYGMAVAPVTDWRFYDSVYTERYMHTPQHNPSGYENASISNMTALSQNVRFLVMHGVADDNVHFQNTLTLLDNLDVAGVENYDDHVFPDSDHSIYFHNANKMVYDRLNDWLINAFNGEWLKLSNPTPNPVRALKRTLRRGLQNIRKVHRGPLKFSK